MERKDDTYDKLVERYLRGEATEEEAKLVNSYFNQLAEGQADFGKPKDIVQRKNRVWRHIAPPSLRPVRLIRNRFRAFAAVAAAAVIAGVWLFYFSVPREKEVSTIVTREDIAPGGLGATLTMADGRQQILDTTKDGVIIGTALTYEDGSPVLGKDAMLGTGAEQLTASTGRGQVYSFTLPDGTKVWLNADSKLSFPSRFGDKERKVRLEGEGFFVVKHDDSKHFFVESKGQVVEDLGTSFNIQSYPEDLAQRTTLVEGAAKVNETLLRPGQQALHQAHKPIRVVEADIDQVLAWQQGNFVFRGETLEEVFRTVARWYDVEVLFKREETKYITVGGTVSRSRSIRAVLDLMERTGKVKCEIQGKQVTVQ
ncbi:FecR family protein [Sphingobacterium yanglingense]|uniref:FecR family protein n=1 Tax=Sphingobacterium yanglingense TaxID=1437280 RepID=A0A4R6WGJ2_9SPHI|nr:FecR domain-containing protein [Sphingobacterium yanglingense]TDQ79273.1 FecR family protein [Sphingobacterium yanglingense]